MKEPNKPTTAAPLHGIVRRPHKFHRKMVGGPMNGSDVPESHGLRNVECFQRFGVGRMEQYRSMCFASPVEFCDLFVHESITDDQAWDAANELL